MTSKRCFSKIMYEDFRHKIWMLALSILGNMLALPVAYLMSSGGNHYSDTTYITYMNQMSSILNFFRSVAVGLGGVIAVIGAIIVGLAGFRYLFRKNMVDTWHSLPIKRNMLYTASWFNGFFIWFVPFLISYFGTLFIAILRMRQLRSDVMCLPGISPEQMDVLEAYSSTGGLVLAALQTFLVLVIAFLLVYNVVLLAVMFSGNVINTIVLSLVFGTGAIIVYGGIQLFLNAYMNTYISPRPESVQHVMYLSPVASSIYLLIQSTSDGKEGHLLWPVIINAVIGIGLGIAAGIVYKYRPSELSEQGVKVKPVRWIAQCIVSVMSTLAGWIIFSSISNDFLGRNTGTETVWGVFGAILLGSLGYGTLNVIFNMDFKAFLKGKLMMAGCVVTGLLVCFGFYHDWLGYDTYLPEKEKIEEISIYMQEASSYSYYSEYYKEDHPLQKLHIKDAEKAYAFLETATKAEKDKKHKENQVTIDYIPEYYEESIYRGSVVTKVTLSNGKVYYRRYTVYSDNCEDALALVTTDDYIIANYVIPDDEMDQYGEIDVWDNWYPVDYRDWTKEERVALYTAYNRDVLEHGDTVITGNCKKIATFSLRGAKNRRISVYENMENTVRLLKELNRFDTIRFPAAEELAEIDFVVDVSGEADEMQLMRCAAARYGVYPEEVKQLIEAERKAAEEKLPDAEGYYYEEVYDYKYGYGSYCMRITDETEMSEVLPFIVKNSVDFNVFQREVCYGVKLVGKNGRTFDAYIMRGTLPEKYIYRFAEAERMEEYY